MTWQLQDAKNKLSEVLSTSLEHGPQIITRRGHKTAVVISFADYQKLVGPQPDLKRLLRHSGVSTLSITRDTSLSGRASEQ